MYKKSLLQKLQENKVDIKKMIESNAEFISSRSGSSGHLNYTERQLEILFASVPSIFPYNFKHDDSKSLTQKQWAVLEIIGEMERNQQYDMRLDKIHEMISTADFYVKGML